ncbi:hypothetical protein BDR26DRAFT_873813 [Obelidium mucronatum]|nr:hypothetical protein BDR26DRAFT_873813 [Obelidium mucronatum]
MNKNTRRVESHSHPSRDGGFEKKSIVQVRQRLKPALVTVPAAFFCACAQAAHCRVFGGEGSLSLCVHLRPPSAASVSSTAASQSAPTPPPALPGFKAATAARPAATAARETQCGVQQSPKKQKRHTPSITASVFTFRASLQSPQSQQISQASPSRRSLTPKFRIQSSSRSATPSQPMRSSNLSASSFTMSQMGSTRRSELLDDSGQLSNRKHIGINAFKLPVAPSTGWGTPADEDAVEETVEFSEQDLFEDENGWADVIDDGGAEFIRIAVEGIITA